MFLLSPSLKKNYSFPIQDSTFFQDPEISKNLLSYLSLSKDSIKRIESKKKISSQQEEGIK